ncbi:hypothetical protein BOTBODRAFT_52011 [Botryobasidium botryosum FD-172 SS1]|uniref:Cysteine-rich PDZ-binding protein n=1 Tax=Botryobasidium botryosum (strain FD-172 SS1) TaxID=930990 RepID=A0A067MYB0_BOTB1|nr:hypothetical protein BOTBODRAFT_52011 [Botryobasidium botryosum FD-172 SS1]
MYSQNCPKQKVSKLAAPDPFQPSGSTRKVGENKLLGRPGTSSKRFQPYQGKCKDCKCTVTQNSAKYCHGCAYKKGICAICGKQILDTTGYAMSSK